MKKEHIEGTRKNYRKIENIYVNVDIVSAFLNIKQTKIQIHGLTATREKSRKFVILQFTSKDLKQLWEIPRKTKIYW